MKKNYEIKCELNIKEVKEKVAALKNFTHTTEKQTDIYFKVKKGRLKLRIINDSSGNLIFYDRGEKTGKRISKYIISQTRDFKDLHNILRKQFKVLVTVIKKRKIFISKNIRVHIDDVKGLGKFLEIEIVCTDNDFSEAKNQMKEIISMLNIDENKFIKESYSDLLINRI